jgi:copper(I)-binding protein
MHLSFRSTFTLVALLILASCSETPQSVIEINDPWLREAPPGATAMAGYLVIKNHTDADMSLNSAVSPDFGRIEFHQSIEENGVYKMLPHTNLNIPAEGSLALEPGSYHLMMINPKRNLTAGDKVSMMLKFGSDNEISVTMPVTKAMHINGDDHSHHHH